MRGDQAEKTLSGQGAQHPATEFLDNLVLAEGWLIQQEAVTGPSQKSNTQTQPLFFTLAQQQGEPSV
jgi:hypothetical protein